MVVSSRGVSGATPLTPVAPAAPAPLVDPTTVYTSITSCDVTFSRSDLTESDTFTVTGAFGGPGWMRIGADGLGPDMASVLVDSAFVSGLPTGSVAEIRAALSMAPGAHTMDFYAVTGSGAASGEPLCRVSYTLTGTTSYPEFAGPTELPRGTRGTLYSSNTGGRGGNGGNGGVGGSYGGGIQLTPSPDGRVIELVDTGLHINLLDVAGQVGPTNCGELSGTPTKAGTYTFTVRLLYKLAPGTVPASVLSSSPATVAEGVDDQTFATYQTFTLIVEETPSFTG